MTEQAPVILSEEKSPSACQVSYSELLTASEESASYTQQSSETIERNLMIIPCYTCKQMSKDGYCKEHKEYLLNGYAKFYYSQRCSKSR